MVAPLKTLQIEVLVLSVTRVSKEYLWWLVYAGGWTGQHMRVCT